MNVDVDVVLARGINIAKHTGMSEWLWQNIEASYKLISCNIYAEDIAQLLVIPPPQYGYGITAKQIIEHIQGLANTNNSFKPTFSAEDVRGFRMFLGIPSWTNQIQYLAGMSSGDKENKPSTEYQRWKNQINEKVANKRSDETYLDILKKVRAEDILRYERDPKSYLLEAESGVNIC